MKAMDFTAEISVSPLHMHGLFWNPLYVPQFPVIVSQIEFHPGMLRFQNTKLFTSFGWSKFFINLPSPLLMTIPGILVRNSEFIILVHTFTGFICVSLSSFSLGSFLCFPRPCFILSSPGADPLFPVGWKLGPNVCNSKASPGVWDGGRS